MPRSDSYRFTVTDRFNDPQLLALRSEVRDRNREVRKSSPGQNVDTYRVVLRARQGRNHGHVFKNRRRGGGPQNIPLALGARFDVYVYTDYGHSKRSKRALVPEHPVDTIRALTDSEVRAWAESPSLSAEAKKTLLELLQLRDICYFNMD